MESAAADAGAPERSWGGSVGRQVRCSKDLVVCNFHHMVMKCVSNSLFFCSIYCVGGWGLNPYYNSVVHHTRFWKLSWFSSWNSIARWGSTCGQCLGFQLLLFLRLADGQGLLCSMEWWGIQLKTTHWVKHFCLPVVLCWRIWRERQGIEHRGEVQPPHKWVSGK